MAEVPAVKETVVKSPPPTPKEGAKKFDWLGLAICVLVLINLLAVGAMGYFVQQIWVRFADIEAKFRDLSLNVEKQAEVTSPIGKEMPSKELGTLFGMESFLVNISSDQGPKFLQAQLELELSEPTVQEELTRKKPAIRDAIIVLLSHRNYQELKDVNGMKRLRVDVVRSVNNLLATGKVREVYFTQFHFN